MRFLLLSNSLESFFELVSVLLVFVFVLVITYFATRWMGNYEKARMKSKNLQIIETIPAGSNKMISLIKAGTVYLVVSVGKDEIHPLATLTEEQLTDFSFMMETSNTETGTESFQEILGQLKEKMSKK